VAWGVITIVIKTNLILIEGIPGTGKSTIASKVCEVLGKRGIECKCYQEWSEDNPIEIGKMEDLSEIISSTNSRSEDVLMQWERVAEGIKGLDSVNVIESRFWQTDGMYLFLSGCSEDIIFENNMRVISAISELNPVLIYLVP